MYYAMPPEPPPVAVAPKGHRIPTACVRLQNVVAVCGREIKSGDFAFTDRAHAVRHYANSKHLRACAECVAAIRKEQGVS